MFFQSWQDFWAMGGHGFYVWLAYGGSFAVTAIFILQSLRGRKAVLNGVLRELQREARLKKQSNKENTL